MVRPFNIAFALSSQLLKIDSCVQEVLLDSSCVGALSAEMGSEAVCPTLCTRGVSCSLTSEPSSKAQIQRLISLFERVMHRESCLPVIFPSRAMRNQHDLLCHSILIYFTYLPNILAL
jgi:hypothetical protein